MSSIGGMIRHRRPRPDFSHEGRIVGPVAGIDEAGRGPWAGPVVAAAAILDRARIPRGLDDSKVLQAETRERLFAELQGAALIGVGAASVEEIERLNILQATFLAMRRALARLPIRPVHVLVDGNRVPDFGLPTEAVIDGDAKALSIAAASIVAKVTRDRIMTRLGARHAAYGWERNMGYGTPEHRDALAASGPCAHHRRGFAPIRRLIEERGAHAISGS